MCALDKNQILINSTVEKKQFENEQNEMRQLIKKKSTERTIKKNSHLRVRKNNVRFR